MTKTERTAHDNGCSVAFLYTVPEVAEYLRCSPRTIFDLMHRGELGFIRVGRLTRIRSDQLQSYLDQPAH